MINYNRLGYEIKRDLANFSKKISKGLKRPKSKFVVQMLYGILAGNKVHLSEIARSLNEDITLKKTIDRLSRNLFNFSEKDIVMDNYIAEVKKQINEEQAVIVIDDSDITKPCSPKMEAISDVHDGSTGEIRKGYLTVEAAVLSKGKKMPMPVYEKIISPAEEGFVSMTHENLRCLESLSAHFGKKCVRTLDRGFDANDYYRYFLKNGEKFVIRAKKNRNVIYRNKTQNIMDVAKLYKGNYRMDFMDKQGRKTECRISYIPIRLCEFPDKELVLVAVYGFGKEPMLLITNLRMTEKKKLCMITAKVYLMRWRIEEYFKFKKQQFDLEDLRVMTLKSIRNLNLFASLSAGYIAIVSAEKEDTIFMLELHECAKRIYGIPKFIFYALGYAIERVLAKTRSGVKGFLVKKEQSQQLTLDDFLDYGCFG
jgi:effector-binding domain-containing protein